MRNAVRIPQGKQTQFENFLISRLIKYEVTEVTVNGESIRAFILYPESLQTEQSILNEFENMSETNR